MAVDRKRTPLTLYAVNFLNAIGGWFFLPLLPIFLGRKGGSVYVLGAATALVPRAAFRRMVELT